MKKNFLVFLLIFLASCSGNELPPGSRAGGFKVTDSIEKEKVFELLKKNKIPYIIDERDFVVYMLRDQAKVLGIVREVKHGDNLDPNYFESTLITSASKEKYESEFKSNEIPYHIDNFGGVEQIYWSQIYGQKVDLIRQKINIELRRESIESAVEEGSIPANLVNP